MRGWRRQYDEFAGPRYPSLIAYAQLLTASRDRADALVAFALRRTFGRWRRRGTNPQVDIEIRRHIVARFLATASAEPALVPADATTEPVEPADPVKPAEVDPSLYAPPGSAPQHTGEFLHAAVTDGAHQMGDDPHESHAPHQLQPRADAEESRQGLSGPAQVHAALAMLTPHARAMTVLRHFDGLAPALIAAQLGVNPDHVIKELRNAYTVLRPQLNITIPDEPDHAAHSTGDGVQQVMVTPHGTSR